MRDTETGTNHSDAIWEQDLLQRQQLTAENTFWENKGLPLLYTQTKHGRFTISFKFKRIDWRLISSQLQEGKDNEGIVI